MEIRSNRMRLNIQCNVWSLTFTLYREDMVVGATLNDHWMVSQMVVATPVHLSAITGAVKNWMVAFGFQECEKLDSALTEFVRNLPRAGSEPHRHEGKPN